MGLLVGGEYQAVLREVEVEADDAPELFLEELVCTELVALESVRLEPSGAPDRVDGVRAHSEPGVPRAGRPVSGVPRLGV